jgi:Type VI secretion system/phage-baseplate injector OB domain
MNQQPRPAGPPYFGKYRAVVSNNADPLGLGRIKAKVEAFGLLESAWAMPSLPYAGPGVGLYLIPPKDAWVWIEYEGGERSRPIWTGCFWKEDPVDPGRLQGAKPAVKQLKTAILTTTIDDDQSAVAIETKDGRVSITKSAVEVTNGKASVKLANQTVSLNGNALEVT